jgi:hypothetical protein
MILRFRFSLFGLALISVFATSCSRPLEWPESPLYSFDKGEPQTTYPDSRENALSKIVGHYAHFDVVAYEDTTTRTTMRTFIISYGFTDFYIEDGKLMQSDRFVHAEQKLSRVNAMSVLRDEAVQAIKPRVTEVDLSLKDGIWNIFRPESPSLLGIDGDPTKPLSTNPNDPNLTDPDNDGHPGVTVKISVGKFFSGEIYLIRREIFRNYMELNPNGTITGHVVDNSEQFVVGASKKILNQKSNNIQHPDKGLNPVLLVKVDPEIDTYEELLKIRDKIFPKEPEFETHKRN